jgi:hypothetical protein
VRNLPARKPDFSGVETGPRDEIRPDPRRWDYPRGPDVAVAGELADDSARVVDSPVTERRLLLSGNPDPTAFAAGGRTLRVEPWTPPEPWGPQGSASWRAATAGAILRSCWQACSSRAGGRGGQ